MGALYEVGRCTDKGERVGEEVAGGGWDPEASPFDKLPAPNDGRSLSFDYTQDRFGTGQAGFIKTEC